MNKRGIALIAIILLIGLVIAAGVTVFTFSRTFASESVEEIEKDKACLDVRIKVLSACYNGGIKIKVESESPREIDRGFIVRILGEKETLVPSLPFTTLEEFAIETIAFPYDEAEMGELEGVVVIPKIRMEDGTQVICSSQSDHLVIEPCELS